MARALGRDLARTAAAALLLAVLLRGAVLEPFEVESGAMAPTLLPGDRLVVSRLAYALRAPFTSWTLAARPPPRRGDVVVVRDPDDPSRRLVRRVVGLPGERVELREQALVLDGVIQPRAARGAFTYREPAGVELAGGLPGEDTCRRFTEFLDLGPPRAGPEAAGGAPTSDGGDEVDAAAAAEAAAWVRVAGGQALAHDLLQCRRRRAGRREAPATPVRPGHLLVLGDCRDRSADGREALEVPLDEVVGRAALVAWSWGPGGWWPRGGAGVRIDRLFKPVE